MRKRSTIVRIVAILLAALFVGSAITAAIYAFAAPQDMQAVQTIVNTGEEEKSMWPVYALVAAIAIVALCIILPKLKKK